mmetsp:Transcript_21251/g.58837  ORF Transcript_21251/g.58837 Transcript_21251/m.58837 type:complete len:207 (-) Transcript_21251:951-1571(-)
MENLVLVLHMGQRTMLQRAITRGGPSGTRLGRALDVPKGAVVASEARAVIQKVTTRRPRRRRRNVVPQEATGLRAIHALGKQGTNSGRVGGGNSHQRLVVVLVVVAIGTPCSSRRGNSGRSRWTIRKGGEYCGFVAGITIVMLLLVLNGCCCWCQRLSSDGSRRRRRHRWWLNHPNALGISRHSILVHMMIAFSQRILFGILLLVG